MVSRLAVEREIEEGELAVITVSGVTLSRNLSAVWREGFAQRADAASLVANVIKFWMPRERHHASMERERALR